MEEKTSEKIKLFIEKNKENMSENVRKLLERAASQAEAEGRGRKA